jgi:hypothetical protein
MATKTGKEEAKMKSEKEGENEELSKLKMNIDGKIRRITSQERVVYAREFINFAKDADFDKTGAGIYDSYFEKRTIDAVALGYYVNEVTVAKEELSSNEPNLNLWFCKGMAALVKYAATQGDEYEEIGVARLIAYVLFCIGVRGFSNQSKNIGDSKVVVNGKEVSVGGALVALNSYGKGKTDTSPVRFLRGYIALVGLPKLKVKDDKFIGFNVNRMSSCVQTLMKLLEGNAVNAIWRDGFYIKENESYATICATFLYIASMKADFKTSNSEKKNKEYYTEGLIKRIEGSGAKIDLKLFPEMTTVVKEWKEKLGM